MPSQLPIGCFDSGFGGLTVVKEIMRQLPQENLIYLGDNNRYPYGSRPPEEVRAFTFEIMDFLVRQGVKMIIMGCNTATAVCLPEARQRYKMPVLGVITPGSRAAITATRSGRIGVIGTEVTIRSDAYARELQRINPRLEVFSKACPPFVHIVETDEVEAPLTMEVVQDYLQVFHDQRVDTLILGCTHYPLLQHVIARVMGNQVQLINSAEETAREANTVLSERGLLNESNPAPYYHYVTTGTVDHFRTIGSKWIGQPLTVRRVDLGDSESQATAG
ncbi:MAG: Glutamate racemase [Bacilli bacterium]|nr:Glutamate racemase [Bacilli bacterium]